MHLKDGEDFHPWVMPGVECLGVDELLLVQRVTACADRVTGSPGLLVLLRANK